MDSSISACKAAHCESATVLKYEVNPREKINLTSLFSSQWERTCWVQILVIQADGWDEFRKYPHAPSVAPPSNSYDPDDHFDDDNNKLPLEKHFEQGWPHGPDHDLETFPGPQIFRLSPQSATGNLNVQHLPPLDATVSPIPMSVKI